MIGIKRELKLTRICPKCQDQYGLWRERCPACGEYNERRAAAIAAPATFTRQPAVNGRFSSRKQRTSTVPHCIFCQRRGPKETCPHCNEPIHRNCRGLHCSDCEQFQRVRLDAETQLAQGAQNG